MYFVQNDFPIAIGMGSYNCITNQTGRVVENKQGKKQIFSFDPWVRLITPNLIYKLKIAVMKGFLLQLGEFRLK